MNPGFEKYEDYMTYRSYLQKVKTIQILDGLNINDRDSLLAYSGKKIKSNLFYQEETEAIPEENDENDLYNIIKQKKRQSTITYSQKMLKKADNLTKFNRKNHSEGNKHITNNDL
jgi:hypothetical protein